MGSFHGRPYFMERHLVTLDSSGDGSKILVFEAPFASTPNVWINQAKGDSGSYSAGSITNTGFTLTVTGSDLVSQDIEFIFIAMEKL